MLSRHGAPAVLSAAGALLSIAWLSAGSQSARTSTPDVAPSQQSGAATEAEARAVCGACHAFPPPEILPRSAWRDSVARMWLIQQGLPEPTGPPGAAARMVTLPPPMQRVLRYYQASAPEGLPAPTPWPAAETRGFAIHKLSPADGPPGPAISHVRALDIDGNGQLDIVAADMRHGLLLQGTAIEAGGGLRVIARVPHPAHFEPAGPQKDGPQDLLVADLGAFLPGDHTLGAVVWLRHDGAGSYAQFAIDGRPRVADIRPGDFDGDGKVDLAVAAFGWRKVGRLSVYESRTTDPSKPVFVEHVIDPRPGAIDAIPVDLNGDGRLDIVALISQQFETVVAYINKGSAFTFEPSEIYTAPHPNWGSSGIQLVDVDRDGDLDVLFTHGDTFDDSIIKPYHGIMWLENTGRFPFEAHSLADLPGVFAAKAGDLDGDGDLDIVACAFIAGGSNLDEANFPSLVWLEQVKPGEFVRHTLERSPPRHATLDLADLDSDGRLDVIVGNFMTDARDAAWVDVWLNRMAKPQ